MTTVLVAHGPNLSRLGAREVDTYGTMSYDDLSANVMQWGADLGLEVVNRQTNDESELVGWIHEAVDQRWHVVLNPAAFTHYSYALRDACAMLSDAQCLLVEVHLSNPAAREEFRHQSVISGVASGTIAGFGPQSYRLGLEAIAAQLG